MSTMKINPARPVTAQPGARAEAKGVSQTLAMLPSLNVRQVKEWGEILTGFETKNKYAVQDPHGQALMLAAEDPGGFKETILRLWLKAKRPFTMSVMDTAGATVLSLKRPFRFIFDRLEIADANGKALGAIQKKWSWVRRIYEVEDTSGRVIFKLFGPILKPWTFEIKKASMDVGKIQKKWSGMGREVFTDADNFIVEMHPSVTPPERLLLVGAVFLIDFVHFENKGN